MAFDVAALCKAASKEKSAATLANLLHDREQRTKLFAARSAVYKEFGASGDDKAAPLVPPPYAIVDDAKGLADVAADVCEKIAPAAEKSDGPPPALIPPGGVRRVHPGHLSIGAGAAAPEWADRPLPAIAGAMLDA